MGDYYYSAKNNGFYSRSMKRNYENSTNGWPEDAIAITEETYNHLFKGQGKGKLIIAGANGQPALIDPPPPTLDEQIAAADARRAALLATATTKIAPLQDAAELDLATDEEKVRLIAWKKYRVDLSRLDISAPEISWPEAPGDVA